MSKRITVNDKVKFTEAFFCSNTSHSKFRGMIGTVVTDDASDIPYEILFTGEYTLWARANEVTLDYSDTETFTTYSAHKLLALLLKGNVLYTTNGTKVHNKDGELMFNKSPLNWTKVVDLPLSTANPDKTPFDIDELRGTHCQVWDTEVDKNDNIYRLINGYVPFRTYKFRAIEGTIWKNAVPVK